MHMTETLILASGSAIRATLLAQAEVPFTVQVAQIDEEFIRIGDLLAILGGRNVNRASSRIHDTYDVLLLRADQDPPRKEIAGIKATRGVHPEVSSIIDMTDVKPDFIHVGRDHHPSRLFLARL